MAHAIHAEQPSFHIGVDVVEADQRERVDAAQIEDAQGMSNRGVESRRGDRDDPRALVLRGHAAQDDQLCW